MKRLKVLHVLAEIKPSGAEMMLLTALQRFRESGIDMILLATGENKGSIAGRFEAAGCEVLHFPFSYSISYFYRIWKLFLSARWDVIHLHTERANFYFGLMAVLARKPVLRTVHNVFSFKGLLRWRRGLQRRLLEWLGLRHVAIGPSVLENETTRFGIKPALVLNWYDDDRFRPMSDEQREKERCLLGVDLDRQLVVVSVGNCSDIKNHKSILNALALIHPSERPLYLHAGLEDSENSERLLAQELGLNLESEVRFLGAVSDIPRLLCVADVYVMPSLFEGMSIASIEALASGVLLLLSDVPGLRDLRENYKGIIYCDPSPESIAASLRQLVHMSPEQRRLAVEGQAASARQRFGIGQGVRGYTELYRGIAT